jgi:hypothetical protein
LKLSSDPVTDVKVRKSDPTARRFPMKTTKIGTTKRPALRPLTAADLRLAVGGSMDTDPIVIAGSAPQPGGTSADRPPTIPTTFPDSSKRAGTV